MSSKHDLSHEVPTPPLQPLPTPPPQNNNIHPHSASSEIPLLPFKPCSSMTVVGPTGSGKTRWVNRLLHHLDMMYGTEPPQKIMWCYGVYQSLYDEMDKTIPHFELHPGLPTQTEVEEFANGDHCLIIIDDLMHQVVESKETQLLFTQGCHHRRLSVIYLSQNIFQQGKSARTIALNSWYTVLFKNVRGTSQIMTLGRQLFPGKANALLEAYQDATNDVFGYLVLDLTPMGQDKYRMRTKVFPRENPIIYTLL